MQKKDHNKVNGEDHSFLRNRMLWYTAGIATLLLVVGIMWTQRYQPTQAEDIARGYQQVVANKSPCVLGELRDVLRRNQPYDTIDAGALNDTQSHVDQSDTGAISYWCTAVAQPRQPGKLWAAGLWVRQLGDSPGVAQILADGETFGEYTLFEIVDYNQSTKVTTWCSPTQGCMAVLSDNQVGLQYGLLLAGAVVADGDIAEELLRLIPKMNDAMAK